MIKSKSIASSGIKVSEECTAARKAVSSNIFFGGEVIVPWQEVPYSTTMCLRPGDSLDPL
jgi:hypothetical protein